jgi:adenylate cyclase
MGIEIERKFLVKNESWRTHTVATQSLEQGYFETTPSVAIRVRIINNAKAFLTLKGKQSGISCAEFEYEIPLSDAQELLSHFCEPRIVRKSRHIVDHRGHRWEIDVFEGKNKGLVVAEIELNSETETFFMPDWVGFDVSADKRYTNASLARNPYTTWQQP